MDLTYYELHEINSSATSQEIKQAFRKLSKKYHPDRNPDSPESETLFKKINEAYQILKNKNTRAKYDQALQNKKFSEPQSKSVMDFWETISPFTRMAAIFIIIFIAALALANVFKLTKT